MVRIRLVMTEVVVGFVESEVTALSEAWETNGTKVAR